MGGICQYVTVGNYAGVFYGESSPVNSCYLTLDYLNGCTPCWPWGLSMLQIRLQRRWISARRFTVFLRG